MPKKAPDKLTAFTEMIGEDINDALDHKLHPEQITLGLLVYAATIAMHYAEMDADKFMEFAADAWNDRVERLEEESLPLPFKD